MDTEPVRQKLNVVWKVHTKVLKVEEQVDRTNYRMDPATGSMTYDQQSRGFFVHFEGSYESLFFGMERPDISPGEEFIITFEKAKKP